ncbi:MAG: hypothetical protein K6A65_01030, partial [Succinivibrionaceae bacterium]|nr:hypothetical protein [Succinivibrionaceae bacterium]
ARVLGLLARVGHDYGSLSVDLLVYRCALLSPPSAMELRVHERALWLWPHELSRLDWLPADRGIIAALADGQPCGTTDPAGSID